MLPEKRRNTDEGSGRSLEGDDTRPLTVAESLRKQAKEAFVEAKKLSDEARSAGMKAMMYLTGSFGGFGVGVYEFGRTIATGAEVVQDVIRDTGNGDPLLVLGHLVASAGSLLVTGIFAGRHFREENKQHDAVGEAGIADERGRELTRRMMAEEASLETPPDHSDNPDTTSNN